MKTKQIKILLDYIDGQNKGMCLDDRESLRKRTEQKLINESSLDEYAYILVDEVHETDIDIDILLVILKHLISKSPNTKLILMSATICIDLFSKYFSKESISSVFIGDMYENLKIGK